MLFYIFCLLCVCVFFFLSSFLAYPESILLFSLLLERGSVFLWRITAFSLPDQEDQVKLILSLLQEWTHNPLLFKLEYQSPGHNEQFSDGHWSQARPVRLLIRSCAGIVRREVLLFCCSSKLIECQLIQLVSTLPQPGGSVIGNETSTKGSFTHLFQCAKRHTPIFFGNMDT